MRDRLIELIDKAIDDMATSCEELADDLLANGVIVPPCKVGDTVYVITEKYPCYACRHVNRFCLLNCVVKDKTKLVIKNAKVSYLLFREMDSTIQVKVKKTKHSVMHFLHFNIKDFGKTVFLTREEAEKALKERAE